MWNGDICRPRHVVTSWRGCVAVFVIELLEFGATLATYRDIKNPADLPAIAASCAKQSVRTVTQQSSTAVCLWINYNYEVPCRVSSTMT